MDAPQGLTLLLLLIVIMLPAERLLPVRRQPIWRPEITTDLLHLVATSMLSRILAAALVAVAVVVLVGLVNHLAPVRALQATVATQPGWLQFFEAMAVLELCAYWTHRASHQWHWWWRLHAVHHSATTLDWLATPRLHPLDQGLRKALKFAPLVLLGFTARTFALVAVIAPFMTFLIHANVRLAWPGPLRYLYTSPQFHHWHHSAGHPDCNYSDQFPWLDALFGTLVLPRDAFPARYGIDGPVGEAMPRSWWGQMVHPFQRIEATHDQTLPVGR